MVGEVMVLLYDMLVSLFSIVDNLFTRLDGWVYLLAAFTLCVIFRFLLKPLLGGREITVGYSDVRRSSGRSSASSSLSDDGYVDYLIRNR